MLIREDQIQRTLINDNSKNSGNKILKSKRFPRADEEVQSIKKLLDLNVRGSSKKQFLRNIRSMLKNLALHEKSFFWPMRFIFNALE